MKKVRRISCLLMAMLMLASMMMVLIVPTSAATKSNGKRSVTITVSTKANWWIPGSESITLSQTKGVCKVNRPIFGTKTSRVYGDWDIVVRATDGTHTYKKNWDDGSITLSLKPNKTYKITVTWDETASYISTAGAGKGSFTTLPTWKVKKTYKCSSCY